MIKGFSVCYHLMPIVKVGTLFDAKFLQTLLQTDQFHLHLLYVHVRLGQVFIVDVIHVLMTES